MVAAFEFEFEPVNLLVDNSLWTDGDRAGANFVQCADIISPIVIVATSDGNYTRAQCEYCGDCGGDRHDDLSSLAIEGDRCIFERQYCMGAIAAMD